MRKRSVVRHFARDIVVRVIAGLLVSVLSVYVFAALRLPREQRSGGVVAAVLRLVGGGRADKQADEVVGTLAMSVNGTRKRYVAVRKAELTAVRVKGLNSYFSGVGSAEGEGLTLIVPQDARPGQVLTGADHPSRYGEPGFDLAYREKDGTLHRLGEGEQADVRVVVTRCGGPGGTLEGTVDAVFTSGGGRRVQLSGGRFSVAVRG